MRLAKNAIKYIAATLALTGASSVFAQQGETVKIAWIDPLSGLMAAVGTNQLKSYQFVAEEFFNKKNAAGVRFEIIGVDNKLSPQETTSALRSVIDQGVRYVVQGNGSGVATAIIDALDKYNARNPGKEVLYVNHAAVDPDLTNSKCSYWHFRLDADTSMKMEALTTYMKEQPEIKKIYLLNQNYSHGHQVVKYAREMMQRKRPDVQFVGDDLHPLAQVRDFAPYIAKIKQSGADTVITGNWGSDMTLLMKAVGDAGLTGVNFYTYYASSAPGAPAAMGAAAVGRVFVVGYAHYNLPGEINKIVVDFKKKFNEDMFTGAVYHTYAMLSAGFAKAKSTEPLKVAAALEGLKFKSFNGEVEMRKTDHQLQQGLFIARWEKAGGKYPIDAEGSGYTFVPVKYYEPYVASTPTSCQMKRPAS